MRGLAWRRALFARRRFLTVLAAGVAGLVSSTSSPPDSEPPPAPEAEEPTRDPGTGDTRSPRRGIHLSPTILRPADYEGLGILHPGSIVLLSAQIGESDPLGQVPADRQLQDWLARRQDVQQIVRMWPVKTPEDPQQLARRIVDLHYQFPWMEWFTPANEPDVEWPSPTWAEIRDWTDEVWQHVDELRRRHGLTRLKLLFPALSQGSRLQPERIGYDRLRPTIERYLSHGDGLAGHEYWDRGHVYLVEERWPAWLRRQLTADTFFVTECGRRPVPDNGEPDEALGEELVSFARRTRAGVVAPFVLASTHGRFDQHAFVDAGGVLRPPLYVWGRWGP